MRTHLAAAENPHDSEDGGTSALISGTLDLLILKVLSCGSSYGYEISAVLSHYADGAFRVDATASYQALRRMERRGLLRSQWRVTNTERNARYYLLTAAGRKKLLADGASFNRYALAMASILALTKAELLPKIRNASRRRSAPSRHADGHHPSLATKRID